MDEDVDAGEDIVEADENEARTKACQIRGHVGMKARTGVAST